MVHIHKKQHSVFCDHTDGSRGHLLSKINHAHMNHSVILVRWGPREWFQKLEVKQWLSEAGKAGQQL